MLPKPALKDVDEVAIVGAHEVSAQPLGSQRRMRAGGIACFLEKVPR